MGISFNSILSKRNKLSRLLIYILKSINLDLLIILFY